VNDKTQLDADLRVIKTLNYKYIVYLNPRYRDAGLAEHSTCASARYFSRFAGHCVAGLFSMSRFTPAHCRAGSPQSVMKPAAAASSKVLFGSYVASSLL
jgi:hypothetical protein